jgi:hypothetical protein
MINLDPNLDPSAADEDASVSAIMRSGAKGALVLAGLATAIVVAIWVVFYLFVFVPRAVSPAPISGPGQRSAPRSNCCFRSSR